MNLQHFVLSIAKNVSNNYFYQKTSLLIYILYLLVIGMLFKERYQTNTF